MSSQGQGHRKCVIDEHAPRLKLPILWGSCAEKIGNKIFGWSGGKLFFCEVETDHGYFKDLYIVVDMNDDIPRNEYVDEGFL